MNFDDPDGIFRCSHGKIILGCPDDDCPEQNAYLADFREKIRKMELAQTKAARELIRPWAVEGDENG